MKTDREWIMEAAAKAASGTPLKRYTTDTIEGAGFCAQLVRETAEGGLGIGPNTWEVGAQAFAHSRKRGGSVRWASDYEAAARELGLQKPPSEMIPGDILYWPYRHANGNNYGHTAIYLGDGLILENTDASTAGMLKKGARQVFGAGTQVFVTPLKLRGTPSTVIYPTTATMQAEKAPAPAIPVPTPQPAPPVLSVPSLPPMRVMVNTGQGKWTNAVGRTITITGADQVVINTTDPQTFWIRYLDKE